MDYRTGDLKDQSAQFDECTERAEQFYQKAKNVQSLKYALKANDLAIESKNSKALAKSYHLVARASAVIGLYKQSFSYIEKALNEKYTQSDLELQIRLLEIKGNNYYNLGLYEFSRNISENIIKQSQREKKNSTILKIASSAFGNIGYTYYQEKKSLDSVFKYNNIEIKVLKTLPEEIVYHQLYSVYINQGSVYLEKKKGDSALFYFEKGYNLFSKYQTEYFFADYYYAMGDYYLSINEKNKSLNYYLKIIEDIDKFQEESSVYLITVYKKISELYGSLGNSEKEKKYLGIYTKKIEERASKDKNNTAFALKLMMNKEQDKNIFLSRWIYIIISISIILLFFILLYYLKEKKKRKTIILDSKKILLEKETETQQMRQMINISFEEIIVLAKENNPHFLKRFQEVYPEFYNNILKINPNLKPSEITLAAYISLGFSNKEIAEYTFKSVRTIESNRYNLRKKLNLSTDIDFFVWLNSMKEL
ncbi:helix-turn-helix transcriptional regulator [Chryseobacterium echinoideorum]|uniref:helix-turn-helix transcriptional regulator n=1 Tax=Chryseobacterium echinoideorum TaxID=1549648 RepID=UPI00162707F3|nr:helix-turn-helix transcriptional regulator [Chryseobacterium echinoideorum]